MKRSRATVTALAALLLSLPVGAVKRSRAAQAAFKHDQCSSHAKH